jgi:hypothetical protein
VTNIDKIKFTGKKFENKKYFKHTGHPGGIKETTPSFLKEKNQTNHILIEVLIEINRQSKSKEKQLSKLKSYSIDLLVNESLLFIDWYLEKREGVLISSDQKKEFIHILNDFYKNIKPQSSTLVLRDYHVDNLFYLSNQKSLNHIWRIQLRHLGNQLNQPALKTFDYLNKINYLRDSLLIPKSMIVVLYFYKNHLKCE